MDVNAVPLSVLNGAGIGISQELFQSFVNSGNCDSPNLRHLEENCFEKTHCFFFISFYKCILYIFLYKIYSMKYIFRSKLRIENYFISTVTAKHLSIFQQYLRIIIPLNMYLKEKTQFLFKYANQAIPISRSFAKLF